MIYGRMIPIFLFTAHYNFLSSAQVTTRRQLSIHLFNSTQSKLVLMKSYMYISRPTQHVQPAVNCQPSYCWENSWSKLTKRKGIK